MNNDYIFEYETGSWILSWLCHLYRRDSGLDVAGFIGVGCRLIVYCEDKDGNIKKIDRWSDGF